MFSTTTNRLHRQLEKISPPSAAEMETHVGTATIGDGKKADLWLMADNIVTLSHPGGLDVVGTRNDIDRSRIKKILQGISPQTESRLPKFSSESVQKTFIKLMPHVVLGLPLAVQEWNGHIQNKHGINLGLKIADIARIDKKIWLVNLNGNHLFEIKYNPSLSAWHYQLSAQGTDITLQHKPSSRDLARSMALHVGGDKIEKLSDAPSAVHKRNEVYRVYRGPLRAHRIIPRL